MALLSCDLSAVHIIKLFDPKEIFSAWDVSEDNGFLSSPPY
jgi:hypothetical protein